MSSSQCHHHLPVPSQPFLCMNMSCSSYGKRDTRTHTWMEMCSCGLKVSHMGHKRAQPQKNAPQNLAQVCREDSTDDSLNSGLACTQSVIAPVWEFWIWSLDVEK